MNSRERGRPHRNDGRQGEQLCVKPTGFLVYIFGVLSQCSHLQNKSWDSCNCFRPLPSKETITSLERSFINDAVSTTFLHRARRLPIIPDYDAITDPQAQSYIQTPRVRRVLQVTLQGRVSSLPWSYRSLYRASWVLYQGPTGHSTGQGEVSTRVLQITLQDKVSSELNPDTQSQEGDAGHSTGEGEFYARVLQVTVQGKVSSPPGSYRSLYRAGWVLYQGSTGHSTGQGEFSTRVLQVTLQGKVTLL